MLTRAASTQLEKVDRALRIAGVALLVGSGLMGLVVGFSEMLFPSRPGGVKEARELSSFLQKAREHVTRTSRVVVVTSVLPIPDFDYWFGATRPVQILLVVDRKRFEVAAPPESVPSTAELEAFVSSLGQLLTIDSFKTAINDSNILVITDKFSTQRLDGLLGGAPGQVLFESAQGSVRDMNRK